MGHNSSGCAKCKVVVARHVLEAETPFGELDLANCMLLRASADGDLEGIKKALDDGADVNTRLPMWVRLGYGGSNDVDDSNSESIDSEPLNSGPLSLTPLTHAAQEGHVEAVELLLRFGANVDLHEADGMQALHFAAMSASVECFRMLLAANANPLAKDNFGRDALECVPLPQITANPSKREWLQLFKESSCWVPSVHDDADNSGCEARPDEEPSESNKTEKEGFREEEEASETAWILGAEGKIFRQAVVMSHMFAI